MRNLLLCTYLVCTLGPFSSAFAEDAPLPLTLNAALHHVYENNPSLLAARQELEGTRELDPQARAGWRPSLNAEASIYTTDVENSNFNSGDGATTKDLTVNLDQPIFRGGRTFAETAQADSLIQAGEALLRQSEQDMFLKTVNVYTNFLYDSEVLDLRMENEEIMQKELKAAQERRKLGETTVTDVHQAKARHQRAKSETIDARARLEASNAEFVEVTGLTPANLDEPETVFDFPALPETMMLMAEEQNPELRIALYEQDAAEHHTDATLRELFPQIAAFASYNKQYDPQPGIVDESETKTIGLRATLALYQGGATRSRIREARHTAKRRTYEIDEVRQKIRREIMSNWRACLAAHAEIESRKAEIDAAKQALDGVREEERLGQRTLLDILDAEQDVLNARITLAKARRDETVTRYALAASLGMPLLPVPEENQK